MRIRYLYLFFFSLLFSSHLFLGAQNEQPFVERHWEGVLYPTKNDSLRIGLTLFYCNDTLVKAELDSPDQYIYGIEASSAKIQNDTLKVVIKKLRAHFIGTLDDKGGYQGVFVQNFRRMALNLRPLNFRFQIKRPQEPHEPYPYQVTELNISDLEGKPLINGTLTYPEEGCKGTIILISGSGWQDRDEAIMGHKPFKVIADYLTRAGYAVYRYDDAEPIRFQKMTTLDFVQDVQTVVSYFKQQDFHNQHPIGLLGHSEGGLVALIAAAENNEIDFIISLAGVGENFTQTLLYQAELYAKNGGLSDQEVEATLEISNKIYKLISKEKNPDKLGKKFDKLMAKYTKNMNDEEKKRLGLTPLELYQKRSTLLSPWFMTIFKIDPERYLNSLKVPFFALNGDKDTQVNGKTHLPVFEKYRKSSSPFSKVKLYPKLNHLFQECETGFLEEYGQIEQTISPEVLGDLVQWLNLICQENKK